MSILDQMEVEHTVGPFLGPFEVTNQQLADLLSVGKDTAARWAREGYIREERQAVIGGGRPTRIFDLRRAVQDLTEEVDTYYQPYIARLQSEIERREAALPSEEEPVEQQTEEAEVEVEIGQMEVLLDRLDHLENLVISLAAKVRNEDPLTGDEAAEVLDIVLRRYND